MCAWVCALLWLAPMQGQEGTGSSGGPGGTGTAAAAPLVGDLPLAGGLLNAQTGISALLGRSEQADASQGPVGLPDFARFQTLGLIVQLQQIPVLDPGYWRSVVGDPFSLGRGTREKVRTTPSAMRLAFYGFYQDQLGALFYERNPNRVYRQGMDNAWTSSFGSLPPDRAPTVLGRFAGTLLNRFSTEELVDLSVYSLASQPAAPRSREKWNRALNVVIYNAAWMAAVYFLVQLTQDQGALRGGRWFTWKGNAWAWGLFASLSRLGFSLRPQLNAEMRFSVPGVETSFVASGEVRQEPNPDNLGTQRLGLEHQLRLNVLSYFRRSLGWEVYAVGGLRYSALEDTLDNRRRPQMRGSVSARREGVLGQAGNTLGLEAGASTSLLGDAQLSGAATLENTAEEIAFGVRANVYRVPERNTGEFRATTFVAFSLQPPFVARVQGRYQMRSQLVWRQLLITQREKQRLDILLEEGGSPAEARRGRRQLAEERRRLRDKLRDFEAARADFAAFAGVPAGDVEGYLSREQQEEIQRWARD